MCVLGGVGGGCMRACVCVRERVRGVDGCGSAGEGGGLGGGRGRGTESYRERMTEGPVCCYKPLCIQAQ